MAETSIANQNSLKGLSSKFGGRTPVRVHFLDNSSKLFLLEQNTTVAEFILIILRKSGILEDEPAVPYFGLYESLNGASIDGVKNMDECVDDIVNSWSGSETAKFIFMIRLFIPSIWGIQHTDVIANRASRPIELVSVDIRLKEAEVIDANLLQLQYIQAVYHIITGQYPVTPDLALQLGAIHFHLKFGTYNESTHVLGYLGNRIVEFIPYKLLKQKKPEEWELSLLQRVKANASTWSKEGEDSPQMRYMKLIWPMAIYGCGFFRCKVNPAYSAATGKVIPENAIVGVFQSGIHVFDKNRNPTRSFRIDEIYRWGYKPDEMFYFEVRFSDDVGDTIEFETTEGKKICDLLTDYAVAVLKERDRSAERTLALKPPTPSPGTAVVAGRKQAEAYDDEFADDDHDDEFEDRSQVSPVGGGAKVSSVAGGAVTTPRSENKAGSVGSRAAVGGGAGVGGGGASTSSKGGSSSAPTPTVTGSRSGEADSASLATPPPSVAGAVGSARGPPPPPPPPPGRPSVAGGNMAIAAAAVAAAAAAVEGQPSAPSPELTQKDKILRRMSMGSNPLQVAQAAAVASLGASMLEKKRLASAVVKIQARYRGYRLRNSWLREDAAILIQSVFRGYRDRVRVGDMIEKLLEEGDLGA